MTEATLTLALQQLEREPPSGSLRFLSDLGREQQRELRRAWPALPAEQRARLVHRLVELAELSIELDFTRVFQVALDDTEGEVRATAVEGLWEQDNPRLVDRLLTMLSVDDSEEVRLATLRVLARHALRCVTGELDEAYRPQFVKPLLAIAEDDRRSSDEQRLALEAVAVFTDNERVQALIERAAQDRRPAVRASALFAMGRNLDPRWLESVLSAIDDASPALRFEATRASGEFGNQRAVPLLLDRLEDRDREVQLAAVTALGKVGGKAAGTALRKLLDSEDEGLAEAAEEALDELNFGDGLFRTD